jgi:hypothetical protein
MIKEFPIRIKEFSQQPKIKEFPNKTKGFPKPNKKK